MNRALLTAAAAVGALPVAQGAISFHDIADVTLDSAGEHLYFDFDAETVSTSYTVEYDFYFNKKNDGRMYLFGINDWDTAGTLIGSSFIPYRYSLHDGLAFSSTAGVLHFNSNNEGPWHGDAGSETKYVALRNSNDGREAWIGVRYNDTAGSLVIESFALGGPSDNMTAGQTAVPEPAETAMLMALLAGGAAAWNRRRKTAGSRAVSA